MNPSDDEHPDLTAHVLGELDAEHDEAMARWIESHPEARAEACQISELAQMLSASAPVSFHSLRADQRAAVLSGPQRVRQMVAAAKQARPRESRARTLVWGLARFAAAAAFAAMGYFVGSYFSRPSPVTVVAAPASGQVDDHAGEPPKTTPFRAKEVPPPVIAEAPEAQKAAVSPPSAPAPEAKLVAVAANVDLPPASPQPKVVAGQPHNLVLSEAFASPSKGALAQVSIRPSDTRPAKSKAEKGQVNAAPMTATSKETPRPAKQPELLIHSWKTDVASCPWDESHRLVRLVVQIPGEQPAAASSANSYPVQMNFSPAAVRSFRQLGERTVPAQQADSPAFHIAWFEVVPNGQSTEGTPRALGDIVLPNARFTTQAMAPFDSSKLRVLDRGASWQSARDDFLFESAIVGFGLLLKGEKDTAGLNHALVLDLAERSKQDDRTGERTKFVKLVQDAQKVAGLR